MATDFSKPQVTDPYATLLPGIQQALTDLSKGLDPTATGTHTNVPTNTLRWSSTNARWELYNGTSWGALAIAYAIDISGNAATASTAAKLGGQLPSYYQQALGYTPLQQGGGINQGVNMLRIGWGTGPYANKMCLQVDSTDFGTTWPMNITGVASSVGGTGYGFSVGKDTSQNLANGISTITFQTATLGIYTNMLLFNPSGMYDTVANALVAPATGWYQVSFSGTFQYTSGGSRVYAYIYFHNNTTGKDVYMGYAELVAPAPGATTLPLSHTVYLAAGETMSVRCNLTKVSGTETAVIAGGTVLSAKFLGA